VERFIAGIIAHDLAMPGAGTPSIQGRLEFGQLLFDAGQTRF